MPTPGPGQVTTCLDSSCLMQFIPQNDLLSFRHFCSSRRSGGCCPLPGLATSMIFSNRKVVWVKCLDFYNFNPVWNEQLPRSKIFWLILTGFKQWESLWDLEGIERVWRLGWARRAIPSICDRKHNLPLLHFTHREKVEHRAKRRIIPGSWGSNRNCNSMVGITFGYANEFLSKYLKLLTFTTLFIEVSIKIVFFSLEVSRWDVLHSCCVQLHYCNGLCLHS